MFGAVRWSRNGTIARKNTCFTIRENDDADGKIGNIQIYKTENTIYKRHYIDSFISLTFQMLVLVPFVASRYTQHSVFLFCSFICLFVCCSAAISFIVEIIHCSKIHAKQKLCVWFTWGFCRASDYAQCIVWSRQQCHFLVSGAHSTGGKYVAGARMYIFRITNDVITQ